MEYKVNLIINGQETDKYEFGAIVANQEEKEIDVIIYRKKSLDEATSNDLKAKT